jgi:hypothetical protein
MPCLCNDIKGVESVIEVEDIARDDNTQNFRAVFEMKEFVVRPLGGIF